LQPAGEAVIVQYLPVCSDDVALGWLLRVWVIVRPSRQPVWKRSIAKPGNTSVSVCGTRPTIFPVAPTALQSVAVEQLMPSS
jgi:hypothetical protein